MRYFCFYSALVLFLIFSSFSMSFAVTLEMDTADKSKLPEGPSPATYPTNKTTGTAYAPSMAQTFTLSLKGLKSNEYYNISAELTCSEYAGFAVNFPTDGTKKYKDLAFLKSDYVQQVNRQTTYPLVWRYKNDQKLVYVKEDSKDPLPGSIVVRCYDWGASGTLTVTVKKKIDHKKWEANGITLTQRIPFDANENGIADAWETETSLKKTLSNGKTGYDPAVDDETITTLLNQNYTDKYPGDGWVIGDEYRGVFKESTDAAVTRLNPMRKEIIVSSEDTSDANDMWSYGTGSYGIPEHDFVQMHPDFVKRPFANAEGLFVWMKKDIGWVNFNSVRKRVYAIRIEKGGIHADGIGVGGESPQGSPAPESKVVIFYTAIERVVGQAKGRKKLSDTQIQASIDVMVNTTISHEIGHSLNLSHCHDKTCLMYQSKKNYKWNNTGTQIVSKRSGFKRHKLNEHYYAVTGAPITKKQRSYVHIEVILDDEGADASPTLTPSNGLYTAEAGDSHTANFSTSSPYSSVYWYVKSPSETGYGTNVETDYGNGSTTTASLTYNFPSGTSGDYVITAYVYDSDNSVSETSYTVTVSLPTSSTPTYSFAPSSGAYSAKAGDSHTATFTSSVAFTSLSWYLKTPSDTSAVYQSTVSGNGTATNATYTYTFPSGTSGDYVFTAKGTIGSTAFDESYTVSVSAPTTTTTPEPTPEPSFSPTASYTINGNTVNFTITTGAPLYGTYLYALGNYNWHGGGITTTTQTLSYTFPDTTAPGTYQIALCVYPWAGNTYGNPKWVYKYVTLPSE